MALNWTTIFTHVGKNIKYANSFGSIASTTLPAALQAIAAAYGVSATTFATAGTPIDGINGAFLGFQNAPSAWQNALLGYITNTLTDQDTVLSQIAGLTDTDIQTVLAALIAQSYIDAQTFTPSVVTVGSVTPGSANIGNGTVYVDATLDGFNAPVQGGQSLQSYNGLLSQLAVSSETLQFVCVQDSGQSGLPIGSEQWSWQGGPVWPLFSWYPQGSGSGPGLTTADGSTFGTNMSLETWASNVPTGWTTVTGTPGTDFAQDTVVFYTGASSLKFIGLGTAQPEIKQSLSPTLFQARRRYLVTFAALRTGTIGGTVKFRVRLTGTGYSAASSEKVDIFCTALTTSFARYAFYINMPNTIPSDLALNVGIYNANLTNATSVNVDSFTFTPVQYNGGVNAQIVLGSTPPVIGDVFNVPISNNRAGVFQTFFGDQYAIQLPTSGSPTISDSLAT